MADITDPRIASNISQHLTDIATKLEGLRAFKNVSIDLDLPDIENFNVALEDEYRSLKKVRDIWKDVAADLYLVKKRKLELTRAEEQYRKESDRVYERMAKERAKQKPDLKHLQNLQDEYDGLVEKLDHINDGLEKMANNQKEVQVVTQHASLALKDFGARLSDKAFKGALQLTTGVLRSIESVALKAYDINNRFRASFAGIASAVGAATPNLQQFQQTAKELYFDKGGLGDLGMDIGQASQEVGSFVSSLGMLNNSLDDSRKELILHGRAIGLDASAVGDAAKTFLLMGQNAADLDGVLARAAKGARAMGVSSALMSKNLLVAGKNLLALAGPKFQDQMANAIVKMTGLGVSVQSLESFTKLTDTFDSNAEAMARLNTAFGTHINALQVFSEEDPAKRFRMVTEQLEQQGKSVQNLGRIEKQFIAQTLGITTDEVNALARGTGTFDEMAEKLKKSQETTMDWNGALQELRTTLVNWGRIFDKVFVSAMKAIQPVLTAFGLEGKDSLGGSVQGITGMVEKLSDRFVAFFARMAGPEGKEFREGLSNILKTVMGIGASFLSFIEGPGFPALIKSLDTILGLVGFILEHSTAFLALWAGAKLFTVFAGIAQGLNAISIATGGTQLAFGGLATSVWAALAPLLPFLAIAAGVGAIGYAGYKLATEDWSKANTSQFGAGSDVEDQMLKTYNPQAYAAKQVSAASAPSAAMAPASGGNAGGGASSPGSSGSSAMAGGSGGGNTHVSVPVQVVLDGEVLQDALYKRSLRSNQ